MALFRKKKKSNVAPEKEECAEVDRRSLEKAVMIARASQLKLCAANNLLDDLLEELIEGK